MELNSFPRNSAPSAEDFLSVSSSPDVRSYLDHLPYGILLLDPRGRIFYANRRLWSFVNQADARPPRNASLDQLSGFGEAIAPLVLRSIEEQEHIEGVLVTIPEISGSDRLFSRPVVRLFGQPVVQPDGVHIGFALLVDTGKHPEKDVMDHQKRLDQLKGVFIATLSHEIRSPLGAINGYSSLLANELKDFEAELGKPLPPQLHEFAGAIQENTMRILDLVNELFDLSNLSQLKLEPVDVHTVLNPLIERLKEAVKEKGISLQIDQHEGPLVAHSNKRRLDQILENLLSNALKFTAEGTISIITRLSADEIVVEVADTGVGITREYLDMLFTPLSQEDGRLNRNFEGAGMGLALVRRLLDLMGGRMEVESEKGQGSTFRLYLPTA